jgi:hypothetical protein
MGGLMSITGEPTQTSSNGNGNGNGDGNGNVNGDGGGDSGGDGSGGGGGVDNEVNTGAGAASAGGSKVGVAVVDVMTGLLTHGAVAAALLARERTGKGQRVVRGASALVTFIRVFFLCCFFGGASDLVIFICVLCPLRTQIFTVSLQLTTLAGHVAV